MLTEITSKSAYAMNTKRTNMGRLYVWMYPETTRNYAGWHLTADPVGCARLVEAIDGLSRGALNEPQVFTVLPATPAVLAVPNNRRAKARWPGKLRLALAVEPRHFSLEERDDVLTITAGRARLEELHTNIVGITHNQGDFAMGPGDGRRRAPDQALWFWWLLP
jgi:hypothetical protein